MNNPPETLHAAIAEGVNAGALAAAAMGLPVRSALPRLLPEPTPRAAGIWNADESLAAAYLPLSGDLFGTAALMLSAREAALALSPMTGGAAAFEPALDELTNIFVQAALAPLIRELNVMLLAAAPRRACGLTSAVWQQLSPGEGMATVAMASLPIEGSSARLHYLLWLAGDLPRELAALRTPSRIDVGLGELRTAQSPAVLRAVSLGSCLAIALYDAQARKGAMAHVVMPESPSDPSKAAAQPGRYADTAIPALLRRLGVRASRATAWLVGGANMFSTAAPQLQVGSRNIERARAALAAAGLKAAEDVGAGYGRTAELFTASGELWVRSGSNVRRIAQPTLK